ncbi:MAG: respiratory nitrate reductase subunit gamma [Candidatus Magnetoovum sp. WYHC-5]|nr:respiratory nitrate reductase subunit gamma [Candidatus Magnetoovum sp. WYHC-5]
MTFLTSIAISSLFYLSVFVFLAGFIYRVSLYYSTPQPLKIPQTPQPVNVGGVVFRMAGDVLFFRSLSKGTTLLFFAGWIFHITLLVTGIRHLRYFLPMVPDVVVWFSHVAIFIGFVLLLSLVVLLIRRIVDKKVVFVSSLSDYFVLLLLICIVFTGLLMRYAPFRPDIVGIKGLMLELVNPVTAFSLLTLHPPHAPANYMFAIHIILVFILLIYFPFSKLMHMGGYFFSPTRYMVNNPRTKRYVNPWDKEPGNLTVSGEGGQNNG